MLSQSRNFLLLLYLMFLYALLNILPPIISLDQFSSPHMSTVHFDSINLLKPTGHVMHQQFNIQQLYALPTLYLSENKQRLVPLTA